jgi:protein gp37
MAANSGIEWTDHTFNPWIGCTKVSPGCDHCYAEAYANRYGTANWGSGQPRKMTSDSNWQQPLKWNREAEKRGLRYRVFCASLADVFDNGVSYEWRERLWRLILDTPHLDWLLLTKRLGNAEQMLPLKGTPKNIWLGISIVNQQEADRDIPKLLATEANVRVLSMEPLLGPVTLFDMPEGVFRGPAVVIDGGMNPSTPDFQAEGYDCSYPGIDWVIVGGESGPDAGPMHPDWARSLRDQCQEAGVPFFFKQWGEWQFVYDRDIDDPDWRSCPKPHWDNERYMNLAGGHGFHGGRVCFARRVGKKAGGRLLDGREWNGLPIPVAP